MPSNALVVADSTDMACVIPFNRQFYVFDTKSVEDGGMVVSSVKSCYKCTVEEYTSFRDSSSDAKWRDFLWPSNILLLELEEGRFPYAFFDVEGHENSRYVANPIPIEVAQKIFPKLLVDVELDPERFGLRLNGVDEAKVKKAKNRIDALRWVPTDCQSSNNKSKTLKPCRPNPQTNGLQTTSPSIKKMHDDMFKILCPPKTSVNKRKSTSAKDSADAAHAIPTGVTFKTKDLLPGICWDMVAELEGGTPKMEIVGDRCYVRVHKKAKVSVEAEEEQVVDGGGGDDDEDDDA